MESTWIDDPQVEQILLSAFKAADNEFSTFFEANSLSNEERLTGIFSKTLIDRTSKINDLLSTWGSVLTSSPWYIKLYYRDVTINRGEKKWGADLAFILDVKIPDIIEFRKTILLQAKKMDSEKNPDGVVFMNRWRIDMPQAKKLQTVTDSSFHILYNPDHNGLGIRILPTKSLMSISKGKGNSTVFSTSDLIPSTRKFSDFMLYDFIGCWVGDFSSKVLSIAQGSDPELMPNHLIRVIIMRKPGMLD